VDTSAAHDDRRRRSTITNLLRLLEENRRFLNSTISRTRRQIAALGLARSQALLEGLVALEDAGRADVCGVLHRAVVETWLLSMYILLKPVPDEEILEELEGERVRRARTLLKHTSDETLAKSLDEYLELRPDIKPVSLDYQRIAADVAALCKAQGLSEHTDPKAIYDVYRQLSDNNIHVNLGTLLRHGKSDDQAWSLAPNPRSFIGWETTHAAKLTAFLAWHVFQAFNVVGWQEFRGVFTDLVSWYASIGVDPQDRP